LLPIETLEGRVRVVARMMTGSYDYRHTVGATGFARATNTNAQRLGWA
jgi:hypothetical protein